MPNTLLKVDNLSHRYDNGAGIEGISFELNPEDFLALIGRSGAGKTTLIHSILGFLKDQGGDVWLRPDLKPSDISFSPQNQAIDW